MYDQPRMLDSYTRPVEVSVAEHRAQVKALGDRDCRSAVLTMQEHMNTNMELARAAEEGKTEAKAPPLVSRHSHANVHRNGPLVADLAGREANGPSRESEEP
jgi:hypothetical protein